MARTLMSIKVCGKQKEWSFNFWGKTEHLKDWLYDGLDVVVIENVIPLWVAEFGLTKPWCFFQSLFYR